MRYLRTYEAIDWELKNKFKELEDTPFRSFSLEELGDDCAIHHINYEELIKEMILNKKIAFLCMSCYDDVQFNTCIKYHHHNVIGICERVIFTNEYYFEIKVKIKGLEYWHSLPSGRKIRIYNYTEGPLMEELETKKNAEKYNL